MEAEEGQPMWMKENRSTYNRDQLRYPSDLTDEEWGHVEPLIPPAKRGGGKRRVAIRAVVNGVMYVLSTGCQWRYIPKDLPLWLSMMQAVGLASRSARSRHLTYRA